MSLDWNRVPKQRQRVPGWLFAILILGVVICAMVLGSVIRRQGTQQKLWPIVRQTATRLQSDAGALDLYRKNPDLQSGYATESAFLERVWTYRGRFSALPEQEPPHRRMAGTGASPWGFRTVVQGNEAFMLLSVQGPGPLGFGAAKGEGISQLVFSDTREGLWKEAQSARMRRRQPEWDRYRAVVASLESEAGTRQLYRASPGLAPAYGSESAFLSAAQGWRPRLTALPADILESGERLRSLHIHDSPFHPRITLTYDFPELRLQATWEGDRLTGLGPEVGEPSKAGPPAPPRPSPSAGSEAPAPRP